jgi:hypothetical protein
MTIVPFEKSTFLFFIPSGTNVKPNTPNIILAIITGTSTVILRTTCKALPKYNFYLLLYIHRIKNFGGICSIYIGVIK